MLYRTSSVPSLKAVDRENLAVEDLVSHPFPMDVGGEKTMKTALVILAAGMGARFGGEIKQLATVGKNGEIIMDYSVHDAIEAGFDKIVFIIRKEIQAAFMEIIGNRMEAICKKLGVEVAYAYQEVEDLPDGIKLPEGRTKPWGTGPAVLACKDILQEPFVVINADDYYGKTAFKKLYAFLQQYRPEEPYSFSMAGFMLGNTLSENGGVTRGICQVDKNGLLIKIKETPEVKKTPEGILANGAFVDADSNVSMNMWGFTPEFLGLLEKGFLEFLKREEKDLLKAEFLIPVYIDQLLAEKQITVKVLQTQDKWFGVTHKEDKAAVEAAFRTLTEEGVYQESLFSDLLV